MLILFLESLCLALPVNHLITTGHLASLSSYSTRGRISLFYFNSMVGGLLLESDEGAPWSFYPGSKQGTLASVSTYEQDRASCWSIWDSSFYLCYSAAAGLLLFSLPCAMEGVFPLGVFMRLCKLYSLISILGICIVTPRTPSTDSGRFSMDINHICP